MKNLSIRITENFIRNGHAGTDMYSIYQYGIQIMLEAICSMAVSMLICFLMDMVVEGIIFFLVFIPLRSFLGGFHLRRFWSCFFLSIITLLAVLLTIKLIPANQVISWIVMFISVMAMCYEMYKTIDVKEENRFFYSKAIVILISLIAMGVVFTVILAKTWLFLVACVSFLIAVSKKIEGAL